MDLDHTTFSRPVVFLLVLRGIWRKFPPFLRAAASAIPVLAVTGYLFSQSRTSERRLLEAEMARQEDNVLLQFQGFVTTRIEALRNVGNFVLSTPVRENRADLSLYVRRLEAGMAGFETIAVADDHGEIRQQFPAAAHGPASVRDSPVFAKAMASREPAATGSFDLPGGQQAFTIMVPTVRDAGPTGAVVGTIRLVDGLRELFGRDAPDWNLEIADRTGRIVYQLLPTDHGTPHAPPSLVDERHVPVADLAWKVRLWPTPLLLSTLHTGQPLRILGIGLVASLVISVANFLLAQRQAHLARSLRETERLASDMEATRRHLSEMVNGIDAVIWESDDATGRFTFVNDYARKLLGIDIAQWEVPARWFDHVHPDDRARAKEISRQAQRPGQTYPGEYRMIDAHGHVIWIREIITVIGREGHSPGRRGVVVDISARVQAEEALRQSQKLESLGVLAGGIAHDFNNLLTTILGNAEMMLPFLAGDAAPGRKHLDKIERTTRRLAELTRQMLAYSGRGQFTVAEVDLNAVITEMAELLTVSATKNVRVVYGLDPELPLMEADASQIRQVVLNLLTNAAEAIGEQGRGEVVINTGAETLDAARAAELFPNQDLDPGAYVRLEVADTGSGMSAETLSKIFDPFFTTKFAGRGLGLAALRGIVRRHRGGIRIFSQLGEGTVFTLLFPASHVRALLPSVVRAAEPLDVRLGGTTVLVVDDEESLRSLVADALGMEGATVLQAVDGEDGIEQFNQHRHDIDAVVLDLTMPKLSGEEVFRQIKAARPDVPIILCSGYTQEDVAKQFVGVELDGFVEKPFTPSQLIDKLRGALSEEGSGKSSAVAGTSVRPAKSDKISEPARDGS